MVPDDCRFHCEFRDLPASSPSASGSARWVWLIFWLIFWLISSIRTPRRVSTFNTRVMTVCSGVAQELR